MLLVDIVSSLINEKSEGGYWDFKLNWHSDNADLLKDIICMANNITTDMKDGYIIFGVKDKCFEIIGVENDKNRKNQENIIGFLNEILWSGEECPEIKVETITIECKELDVIIVKNKDITPFYTLKDYPKSVGSGKTKNIVKAGVIYSRIGDRNTNSDKCATKQQCEFLWRKRFGLLGSDEFKVIKRLQNIDDWYFEDYDNNKAILNRVYSDIKIVSCFDDDHSFFEIDEPRKPNFENTFVQVMDWPYLFTYWLNWNIGKNETIHRGKWDIFLDGRKLEEKFSLYAVRATKQTYFHIEPESKFLDREFEIFLDSKSCSTAKYFYFLENTVNFLAYELFFKLESYKDDCIISKENALTVIPIFKDEQEHTDFMDYILTNKAEFKDEVDKQKACDVFPKYASEVASIIVYKLGKTLVLYLEDWRLKCYK